jgi:hypothetical protein
VKRSLAVLSLVLACTAAACHNNSSSSTTPTTPSTPTTTETHSGTVAVGGSDTSTYTLAQAGEVDVTLTAAAPPAGIIMGLAVGFLDVNNNCVPVVGAALATPAGTAPQLSLLMSSSACVTVKDVGNATAPVSYTITVSHP